MWAELFPVLLCAFEGARKSHQKGKQQKMKQGSAVALSLGRSIFMQMHVTVKIKLCYVAFDFCNSWGVTGLKLFMACQKYFLT